jgi:hypothetical protein
MRKKAMARARHTETIVPPLAMAKSGMEDSVCLLIHSSRKTSSNFFLTSQEAFSPS